MAFDNAFFAVWTPRAQALLRIGLFTRPAALLAGAGAWSADAMWRDKASPVA